MCRGGRGSLREGRCVMVKWGGPCALVQVDTAGLDILLVGDSVAMVVHGHDTTLPVTLDEMLTHCKAVSRGSRRCAAFPPTDMRPLPSWTQSPVEAPAQAAPAQPAWQLGAALDLSGMKAWMLDTGMAKGGAWV